MKKLAFIWLALVMAIGLSEGCASGERLVVYADPWLSEYADSMCQEFKRQNPEVEVHLKTISSELIAQHIRFGQPVDIFLCLGAEWLQQPDFREKVAEETVLAASQVVEVVQSDSTHVKKQMEMATQGRFMMEASDRPMRRYSEQAGFKYAGSGATIVANFQSQAVDYLLKGWVPRGFVPLHFARTHAAKFKPVRTGPVIPNAFTAILLKNAPSPALAAEFFAQTSSEKSRAVLAKLGFLP